MLLPPIGQAKDGNVPNPVKGPRGTRSPGPHWRVMLRHSQFYILKSSHLLKPRAYPATPHPLQDVWTQPLDPTGNTRLSTGRWGLEPIVQIFGATGPPCSLTPSTSRLPQSRTRDTQSEGRKRLGLETDHPYFLVGRAILDSPLSTGEGGLASASANNDLQEAAPCFPASVSGPLKPVWKERGHLADLAPDLPGPSAAPSPDRTAGDQPLGQGASSGAHHQLPTSAWRGRTCSALGKSLVRQMPCQLEQVENPQQLVWGLGLVPSTGYASQRWGWEMFLHLAKNALFRHHAGSPAPIEPGSLPAFLLCH